MPRIQVTIDGDSRLEIAFIDRFNTRLVTTFNYTTIADLHTLQITTAQANSFQSAGKIRFSATDLMNGDYSASALTSLSAGSQLHRLGLLFTDSLKTD
jgi:hypothetical protein